MALGIRGESLAAAYLTDRGYTILDRRVRCAGTDIDIIAWAPDGMLHFVEVKTRRTGSRGILSPYSDFSPALSLTGRKTTHMIRAAERYLSIKGMTGEISLDAVLVQISTDSSLPVIHHYTDLCR